MQIEVSSQSNPVKDKPDYAALVLHTLARTLDEVRFEHRATACLTDLSTALNCARISFGLLHGDIIHIEAISHTTKIDTGSALHADLSDAMEEAIDQKASIRLPKTFSTQKKLLLTRANEQLKSRMGGLTQVIPFSIQNTCVGAISFEWDSMHLMYAPEEEELNQIVNIIGAILYMAYQEDRSLISKTQDAMKQWTQDIFGTTRWRQLTLLSFLVVLTAGMAFMPIDNKITANARLEGSFERVIAAPMDGFIEQVLVRPGDKVVAGQTVIQLSGEDLLLEAQRLETERSQHETAYIAAFARSDRSAMMSSLSQAEEARAQLALVRQQLARLSLISATDGIVIDGDIAQLQGAPVTRGEILLTLAPPDGYRVVLNVDERDIGRISIGQTGRLLLSALPHEPLAIRIERITPMAQIIDGVNAYRVEAYLEDSSARLRPGLNGVAKISSERMPLFASIWQWLDQRLRLIWWRLGGG